MKYFKHADKFNEEQILDLTKQGLVAREIANIVGIPKRTFDAMLKYYDIGTNNGHIKKDDNFFDEIDSELKAYLLGYLVADGCVSLELKKNGSYNYRIAFCVSQDDMEVIDMYKKFVFPNNAVCTKDYSKDGVNRKPQVRLRASSKHMVETLINKYHIHPRKTYDSVFKFPNIAKHLQLDFIRGLFDGDGTISKQGAVSIVNGSLPFLQDVCLIIQDRIPTATFNYYSRQSDTANWHICTINTGAKHGTTKQLAKLLYNDKSYYLTRKYNKFNIFNTELTPSISKGEEVA